MCISHSVVSDSLWPHGVAHQAPLSMEFSRQEHWSGQPFHSPGIFPTPGQNPGLLNFRQMLYCLSHWVRPYPHVIVTIYSHGFISFIRPNAIYSQLYLASNILENSTLSFAPLLLRLTSKIPMPGIISWLEIIVMCVNRSWHPSLFDFSSLYFRHSKCFTFYSNYSLPSSLTLFILFLNM